MTDSDNTEALDIIDNMRSGLGLARNLQWIGPPVLVVLLAGIGFLGGRSWHTRLAWAAAILAVACLLIVIAAGPVYSAVGSSRIEDLRLEAVQDLGGTRLLAADKFLTMLNIMADDFFSGLFTRSLIIFILALLLLMSALIWPTWIRFWLGRKFRDFKDRLTPSRPPQPVTDSWSASNPLEPWTEATQEAQLTPRESQGTIVAPEPEPSSVATAVEVKSGSQNALEDTQTPS